MKNKNTALIVATAGLILLGASGVQAGEAGKPSITVTPGVYSQQTLPQVKKKNCWRKHWRRWWNRHHHIKNKRHVSCK
jgi:hypothetical protein